MIKLGGPRFSDAGERVCVSASGVGAGFSVSVTSGDKEVKVSVVIDPQSHTAEICFTVPPGSKGVTVWAKNAADTRNTTFTILT